VGTYLNNLKNYLTFRVAGNGIYLISLVAVGMPVAQHPPHRSVREELPHTAPALGHDVQVQSCLLPYSVKRT
jgi:hypothetical protein